MTVDSRGQPQVPERRKLIPAILEMNYKAPSSMALRYDALYIIDAYMLSIYCDLCTLPFGMQCFSHVEEPYKIILIVFCLILDFGITYEFVKCYARVCYYRF